MLPPAPLRPPLPRFDITPTRPPPPRRDYQFERSNAGKKDKPKPLEFEMVHVRKTDPPVDYEVVSPRLKIARSLAHKNCVCSLVPNCPAHKTVADVYNAQGEGLLIAVRPDEDNRPQLYERAEITHPDAEFGMTGVPFYGLAYWHLKSLVRSVGTCHPTRFGLGIGAIMFGILALL